MDNDNRLLLYIIGEISFKELIILKEKIVKGEAKTENERRKLIDKIQSLTESRTLCAPDVKAERDFRDDIKIVGVDNVARYFNNLCSQYARLKGKEYNSNALSQGYVLNFYGEQKNLPLSTRAGEPSDYIDSIIGIYGGKNIYDYSQEELDLIYKHFSEACTILKDCIEKCEPDFLPYYDGMDSEKVKKNLIYLADRGMYIIHDFVENGLQEKSDNRAINTK